MKTNIIPQKLEELKREELKLFHSYNRHAVSTIKLEVLRKITEVILKQDVLKEVNQ